MLTVLVMWGGRAGGAGAAGGETWAPRTWVCMLGWEFEFWKRARSGLFLGLCSEGLLHVDCVGGGRGTRAPMSERKRALLFKRNKTRQAFVF